ncbi:MAG: helix-turn-helix domain-containing protein [Acetatifactor sp.]|nr:helix-turn-helix domain-containing protein [Acetatifactor sp.]
MINLGERLKELCEERHISMNEFAKLSGVPASTVKNIIYGNSKNPGIETVAKLCKAMGVSLAEFFEEKY